MKKVFFSAVALVAFSFAGMANEIEEKKVEVEKVEVQTDCRVERLRAYSEMRIAGIGPADASGTSYGIYFASLNTQTIVAF